MQARSDSMPCNTFKGILRNLTNFCDNKQLDKEDKFWEVLPVINESNRRFLKISFDSNNINCMIPCYVTHGSRQQINKALQEEYKICLLAAERYGYEVQFRPYQGAKKRKQLASSTK